MKSGLEGRNNFRRELHNELNNNVSMKSGLEGRNNVAFRRGAILPLWRLNEVRPRRPEQLHKTIQRMTHIKMSQ